MEKVLPAEKQVNSDFVLPAKNKIKNMSDKSFAEFVNSIPYDFELPQDYRRILRRRIKKLKQKKAGKFNYTPGSRTKKGKPAVKRIITKDHSIYNRLKEKAEKQDEAQNQIK